MTSSSSSSHVHVTVTLRNTNALFEFQNIPVEPVPKVTVSIRFAYILQDWEEYMFDWPQAPPGLYMLLSMPSKLI